MCTCTKWIFKQSSFWGYIPRLKTLDVSEFSELWMFVINIINAWNAFMNVCKHMCVGCFIYYFLCNCRPTTSCTHMEKTNKNKKQQQESNYDILSEVTQEQWACMTEGSLVQMCHLQRRHLPHSTASST